jgi:hypothetical protein
VAVDDLHEAWQLQGLRARLLGDVDGVRHHRVRLPASTPSKHSQGMSGNCTAPIVRRGLPESAVWGRPAAHRVLVGVVDVPEVQPVGQAELATLVAAPCPQSPTLHETAAAEKRRSAQGAVRSGGLSHSLVSQGPPRHDRHWPGQTCCSDFSAIDSVRFHHGCVQLTACRKYDGAGVTCRTFPPRARTRRFRADRIGRGEGHRVR